MPGFLLHQGATVLCLHGGQAQATAPFRDQHAPVRQKSEPPGMLQIFSDGHHLEEAVVTRE